MFGILVLVFTSALSLVLTSPLVRQAPMECPLTDGNLRTVKLFIKDKESCSELCSKDPQCNFYKFYQAQDGKPPQCFFYQTCGRSVYVAPPECIMSRENSIAIKPFISSEEECQSLCQKSKTCGYYKYIEGVDILNILNYCYFLTETFRQETQTRGRLRRGERSDRKTDPDISAIR